MSTASLNPGFDEVSPDRDGCLTAYSYFPSSEAKLPMGAEV